MLFMLFCYCICDVTYVCFQVVFIPLCGVSLLWPVLSGICVLGLVFLT
jgi:hypothetical protein